MRSRPSRPGAAGSGMIGASSIGGQTVMSGPNNQPLLVLDQVKKGRVAELMSDQIWLWARGFEGGGPQAELLRRLAHWLMKEPELEAENLSAAVVDGEMVVTRRSMAPDAQPVEMTTPSGSHSIITLEQDRARHVARHHEGERAGALSPHRRHFVGGDGGGTAQSEGSRRHARHLRHSGSAGEKQRRLRALADGWHGGRTPGGAGTDGLWRELDRAPAQQCAYRVTALEQEPLLPAWAALLLVVGSLFLAWRIEGR